jgi:hypothetical protein
VGRRNRRGWAAPPFNSSTMQHLLPSPVLWSCGAWCAQFQAALLPTHPPAGGGAQSLELSFVNSRGERLQGLLLDTGSEDVVILCHGCVASKGADHAGCS